MEQKCKICGNETNGCCSYYVEGKHNFIYLVCQSCYEKRMSSIDPIIILQAKVEAIVESLSSSQRLEVEHTAENIVARQVFRDVGD